MSKWIVDDYQLGIIASCVNPYPRTFIESRIKSIGGEPMEELITCEDCKFSEKRQALDSLGYSYTVVRCHNPEFVDEGSLEVLPNDYCAWARRCRQ